MFYLLLLFSCASINAAHNQTDSLSIVRPCNECGLEKSDLKACSQCHSVLYCGVNCQKKAWKHHQRICPNMHLIAKDNESVCRYYQDQEVREITQKEFKALTKKIFTKGSLFSKAAKSKLPCHQAQGEIAPDAVGLVYEGNARGFGVVALRDIKAGEILCGFGGEGIAKSIFEKEKHSNETESCAIAMAEFILDPTTYASLAAFINDGPPNCELINIFISDAQKSTLFVSLEKVAVAIIGIKKGEYLFTDYYFNHSIKQAPYSINEDSLKKFAQKYTHALDFQKLASRGQVANSFVNGQIDAEFLNLTKLQYILATPYVNATLHTKFALDPQKTLSTLASLKQNSNNSSIWQNILNAQTLLKALTKMGNENRVKFADLVQEISQQSLVILCSFIIEQSSNLNIDDVIILGRALDRVKLLTQGTLLGSYWNSSEIEFFKDKYFSEEYQQALYDERDLEMLSKEYLGFYRKTRESFMGNIEFRKFENALNQTGNLREELDAQKQITATQGAKKMTEKIKS